MKGLKTVLTAIACTVMMGTCVFAENTYILPESNTRKYTKEEVQNLDIKTICYAKNEIYARHGRKFQSTELQNYFNTQEWYQGTIEPDSFDESVFNEFEKANAYMLADVEHTLDPNGYALDQNEGTGTVQTSEVVSQAPLTPQTEAQKPSFDLLDSLRMVNEEGFVKFDTKYFTMRLPADLKCAYTQIDPTSFSIFSTTVNQADSTKGEVVTIKAYSIKDTAYNNLTNGQIIGSNSFVVFVAFYPKDLQYNPEDMTQATDYVNALHWAYSLTNQENNLFITK